MSASQNLDGSNSRSPRTQCCLAEGWNVRVERGSWGGNNEVSPPPTPCWLFVWTNRLSRSTHCGWNTDVRPSSLCATFPKRVNWLRLRFVRLRTHSHPPPFLPRWGAAAGDEHRLVAKYQASLRLKSCRDTVEDSDATLQRR